MQLTLCDFSGTSLSSRIKVLLQCSDESEKQLMQDYLTSIRTPISAIERMPNQSWHIVTYLNRNEQIMAKLTA